MADTMGLTTDFSQWDAALDQLSGRQAPLAIMRAINRTATNARAAMVPVVATDMGIKQADVRKAISIQNAQIDILKATLLASVIRLTLIKFNAKGPEPSRGQGSGVTATVPGGAGRYPHAFIATMKNGHRGVFERDGKKRLGIYQLHGASIAQSFAKNGETAQARATEMLPVNMQHEMEFLLQQAQQ